MRNIADTPQIPHSQFPFPNNSLFAIPIIDISHPAQNIRVQKILEYVVDNAR